MLHNYLWYNIVGIILGKEICVWMLSIFVEFKELGIIMISMNSICTNEELVSFYHPKLSTNTRNIHQSNMLIQPVH